MDVFRTADAGAAPQGVGIRHLWDSVLCGRTGSSRRRRRWLSAAVLGIAAGACGCQLTTPFADRKSKESAQEALAKALEEGRRKESAAEAEGATLSVAEHLQLGEQELERNSQSPQELESARRHFESVLAAEPNHPTAHHRLAVIADLRKEFSRAEGHYAKALQGNPSDAYLLHDIGYSYALQGRHAEAVPYYQRALEHSPGWEQAARKLADAYVRTGQSELAGQTLARVFPQDQAEEELARLERAHDPAAKPSLIGRMRSNLQDLRPESREEEADPTQQLLADLQQAKIEAERERMERERELRAQGVYERAPAVPNSQLAEALSRIDASGERVDASGRPIYLDGARYDQQRLANFGGMHAADPYRGGSRGYQSQQPHGGVQQYPPAYAPAGAIVAQGVAANQGMSSYAAPRPIPASSFATSQPTAFQPAEVIRGTERGIAQAWPSSAAREGYPQPAGGDSLQPAGSMVQAVAGTTPGDLSSWQGPPDAASGRGVNRADYSAAPPSYGGQQRTQDPVVWNTNSPAMLNPAPAQPIASAPPGAQQPGPASVEEEYRAAAAMGMGVGPSQMFPVLRQTTQSGPGTNSMWNGAQYPQPGRYLPTDRPAAELSQAHQTPTAPHGRPNLMAPPPNSHGQQMPANGQYYTQPEQYTSGTQWGTQPNFQSQAPQPGTPNPLSAYEQQRAAHDSDRNSLIEQVRGQHPANAIATPSTGVPMNQTPPTAQMMNSWNRGQVGPDPSYAAAPGGQQAAGQQFGAGFRGTPVPSQATGSQWTQETPIHSARPEAALQPAARPLQQPTYEAGVVVPPPYQGSVSAPPQYGQAQYAQTQYSEPQQVRQAPSRSSNGYGGPMIVPGR
jgi:Tfp pilus assembly protein PilF